MRFFIILVTVFFFPSTLIFGQDQGVPSDFGSHKVKRNQTLYSISKTYDISVEQLKEYNPLVDRIGLRKRTILRIPIYKTGEPVAEEVTENIEDGDFQTYKVKAKETKWRIAYNHQISVKTLDSLNPELSEVLKLDQEIRVPIMFTAAVSETWDSTYNYYTVKPKEGYYRIEKKIGVNQLVLDSLNPKLVEAGLQPGMILRVPMEIKRNHKEEDDLLVERISLLDSIKESKSIRLSVMLPFKVNEIEFESIENTRELLKRRNLHTLSTDFYFGILMAAETLSQSGIEVQLSVYDTENNTKKIDSIVNENDFSDTAAIIGPLISSNFDYLSTKSKLKNVPKIAPLSTNPVAPRAAVYQSVIPKEILQKEMMAYLNKTLNREDNIVIVADTTNRYSERNLKKMFPNAIVLRPEKTGYLLPDLVDSLLVDSLPNKVILESQNFSLISSVSSQLSAQVSRDREVQLFTTLRSNAYQNKNISRKQLGLLKFTYTTGSLPLKQGEYNTFQKKYIARFGKQPGREAIKGYDLTMDILLRTAYCGSMENTKDIGETQYEENRFLYVNETPDNYINGGYFILQHSGYDIREIKK